MIDGDGEYWYSTSLEGGVVACSAFFGGAISEVRRG